MNLPKPFFLLISIIIFFASCEKDVSPSLENHKDSIVYINRKIEVGMRELYLWYDKLPLEINPAEYSSPSEFLNAITYKPLDRWSYILTKKEYDDFYVGGKYIGLGFSFAIDGNGKIRVRFVYSGSEMYKSGVRRGWTIEKVNDVDADSTNISELLGPSKEGLTRSFVFKKPDSSLISLSFTKKEQIINTVLFCDTFQIGQKVVGYLVFNDFLASAKTELEEAFNYLKACNISVLILDLRYNTGGSTDIEVYLAGILGGTKADNQVFSKMIYNDKNNYRNKTDYFKKNDQSIDFENIYFITSNSTASASEDLINGLKPIIPCWLIGSHTHGKPTGMNLIPILDYFMVAVTFKVTNKDDVGDFYQGLPVDKEMYDDLDYDFGNRNEACLRQALGHIREGSFLSRKSGNYAGANCKSYDKIIGAY